MDIQVIKERLLEIMNEPNYQPSNVATLFDLLQFDSAYQFTLLVKALNALEDEYLIARNKKDCFDLLARLNYAKGIIDVKDSQYANILE